MTDTESGLPPAIEQLWGLREPARRGGPKPALSLPRIVAAAIELADAGGLAALSMSRLAEKLGFTTMPVYRYVASKDDLLVLCLDEAIGAAPALDGPWRAQLEAWSGALRIRYQQHAWMLDVPISGLPAGPNQLVWFERGLRALAPTTLEPAERASTVLLLSTYVRGQVQMVADLMRAAAPASGPPVDWASVVRRVAHPDRFPEVAKLVAGGVFDAEGFPDDEFEFGLRRVLDGVETLDRSRA
ncbi:MAG TPA: TetR/AcrR family transcriptional regulator [Mycobacteriales bacterium]|nr:TetR/AcrR family transcriptional regulator [Mycobacteriales bacterium]